MKTITALIIVICLAGASCLQAQTEKATGYWGIVLAHKNF